MVIPLPTSSRPLLCLAAAWAAAATAFSQSSEDGVVQTPGLLVTGARLAPEASGSTRIDLQPEIDAPLGSWGLLSRDVANFHAADSGAGGFGGLFALRGLANTPYFSDPAVTVYFADIPLPGAFTYPSSLFGFYSASVYRGPEGTEFGRATDGGVVVFDRAGDPAGAGGEILNGYGSYGWRQEAAEAHTGSSGAADAEVDAAYDARAGYIANQQLGARVDGQEAENAFVRLRLRPAAGDELTLEALGSRARDGAQPLVPLGGPLFAVSRAMEGLTDLDGWGAALKGSFALPALGVLTTVTSYTDWRMNPYEDFLVLPPPLQSRVVQDQKSWNEEVHLRTDPLAAVRADMGAWLSRGTTDNSVNRAIPGLFPVEVSSFEQGNQSVALFGEAVYAPDEAWQLAAGLRAESDEKEFARREQVPVPGLDYDASGRYDGLLPKVSATWSAGPDSHAEAAVALGLRPGGFASYTDNPALIPFAEERSAAYSAGWDAAFSKAGVHLAVRAFYDDISNLQIERSFTATDYFVATAPRAHSVGAEVEGRWQPSAEWTAVLDAGWSYVRLDSFRAPLSGLDESGNAAPDAPRFNAGLEVTCRPARGWFATARLAAVGRTYFDEMETARYTQDAYALVGLRAGYGTARWTLAVFGENLANRGYYELIIPGVNSGDPGAPRTVGARAALRF